MDQSLVGPVSPDAQNFCRSEYGVCQPRNSLAWIGVALDLPFQKQNRFSTQACPEYAVESDPLRLSFVSFFLVPVDCVRLYLDPPQGPQGRSNLTLKHVFLLAKRNVLLPAANSQRSI